MSWRNIIWIAIILCLAAVALHLSGQRGPHAEPTDPAVKDLAGALETYELLNEHGYRVLPPARATQGAIEGMVRQVDDFSVYIPPHKLNDFNRQASGERFGTGLRIGRHGERILITGPMSGSPAHKAELYGPMEIVAIGQERAADLTLAAAREMLRADDGEPVEIRLRDRDGIDTTHELSPETYRLPTVTGIVRDENGRWVHLLDEPHGIYYIRISEFVDKRTPKELYDAYPRSPPPRALVLDLRGNPGGTGLQVAAAVADRFLPEGLIVRTEPRKRKPDTFDAHAAGTFPPVPTVVLIDRGTASAAEIVAGALQTHGRGLLVGERSYGKWCVQSTFDLGHGLGKVHLTTARFHLTPARRPAAATTAPRTGQAPAPEPEMPRWLDPEVPVKLTSRAAQRLEALRVQAMVVPRPRRSTTTAPRLSAPAERLRRAILRYDAPLARALKLLREERVPTTRPAGAPALRTRPAKTTRSRTPWH